MELQFTYKYDYSTYIHVLWAYVKHQAGTTLSLLLALHDFIRYANTYEYNYKIQVWHDKILLHVFLVKIRHNSVWHLYHVTAENSAIH